MPHIDSPLQEPHPRHASATIVTTEREYIPPKPPTRNILPRGSPHKRTPIGQRAGVDLNTKFRYANFEITWTIDGKSTVFLDLTIFKGAGWLRTTYLDTATFAKHINAYLYIAFNSCVPKSIKRSFITAEIQRHLRRCSDPGDYYAELCKFYNRLRARGYPQRFLQPLFENCPSHHQRSTFLFKITDNSNNKADDIPSVLALPFSEFADDYFASILKDRLAELPPHLATVRKIAAWYKVPKIKDLYYMY